MTTLLGAFRCRLFGSATVAESHFRLGDIRGEEVLDLSLVITLNRRIALLDHRPEGLRLHPRSSQHVVLSRGLFGCRAFGCPRVCELLFRVVAHPTPFRGV